MLEYLAVRAPLAAPDCYQGYARFLGGLDAGVDVGVPDAQFDIRPMREYDGRPLYKMMYTCAGEDALSPVRAALSDRFRFVTQEAFSAACLSGEIIDRRFSKGSGVRCAAEALGFSLADTIGFGDSMNDYEMIETVGLGVCMENGCDALKRISDLVCPAVEDDGLARAFADLGLG